MGTALLAASRLPEAASTPFLTTPVSTMNVRLLLVRAAQPAALSLALTSLTASAQDAPAAPRADQTAAPATAAADEAAPIDKFDLAAAIMAPSGGLTADEAAKKARERGPQIKSAQASAAMASQDVDSSWDAFLPRIDFAAQYKRIKDIENNVSFDPSAFLPQSIIDQIADEQAMNPTAMSSSGTGGFTQPKHQYALTGSIRYPVSDVLLRAWPAYKASVGSAAASKTQTEVAEAIVSLNARVAFYDYARALAQRAVDDQALRQAEAQAKQIKLFVDAGTSAKVDYLTATARVEEARSGLANSEARVAITQSNLSVLTGLTLDEVKGIAEPVLDAPVAPTTPAEDLVRKAIEQRAELRALRKLVDASDLSHTAQKRSGLPQLVVSANGLSGQPNPRYIPVNTNDFKESWEVGVGIEWSPNNTLASVRSARRASAQLQKARADLQTQEDAVRNEVISAYQNYKSAEAVGAASQARLEAAEEAYRVRLATYRVGAGVIVDLLNADIDVTRARLALANAAINTRAALATLNRAAALAN